MKISIDTNEDSHDHIKHVIEMLQNLVGSNAVTNSETGTDTGYTNIFAENPKPPEPKPETQSRPAQSTTSETPFFNIFGEGTQAPPTESSAQPAQTQPAAASQQDNPDDPRFQKPSIKTTTPERAPPENAPPDVDMFDFFNKTKDNNKVEPY